MTDANFTRPGAVDLYSLTQQAAADALGIRLSNYQILERGRKFGIDDAPRAIDRRTALACAAIAAGLEPYGD